MKTHTSLGEEILEAAIASDNNPDEIDVLSIAKNIAGYHHEKWDGTGYPRQLSGTKIPLCARIMALADMYDALVCERVYKKAWSHEAAAQEINQLSGSHFDPNVVEAFNVISEEFKHIARDYAD
jgi:putative two-component system response regulator